MAKVKMLSFPNQVLYIRCRIDLGLNQGGRACTNIDDTTVSMPQVMRLRRRSFLLCLVLCALCGYLLVYMMSRESDKRKEEGETGADVSLGGQRTIFEEESLEMRGDEKPRLGAAVDARQVQVPGPHVPEMKRADTAAAAAKTRPASPVNYCLHAFYYAWYGTPETDGKYVHWNHPYIRHWNQEVAKKYPDRVHSPPHDIGASFYPELGPYSSSDPKIIDAHMQQLVAARIGVLVVSWYPPDRGDDNGVPVDGLIPILLDHAGKYSLKVALHSEPYEGRSAASVLKDIRYIYKKYVHHPAYLRYGMNGKDPLPVLYVYDSYLVPDWGDIFTTSGISSIRGTDLDVVAISLLVGRDHEKFVVNSGFDGFYTYFGTDKFSYGSTQANWKRLAEFARLNSLLFVPSVAPGYDDTQVRPWNKENTRARANGYYYTRSIFAALGSDPQIVSITSFNEWHEGTQIEAAVPKRNAQYVYEDYSPNPPGHYITLTKDRFKEFLCSQDE